MKHIDEVELIAYQLRETDNAVSIREHLEHCPECARMAESIAETLRVFSAEPVPQANLDHAWQRLRGSLPPVAAPPRRTRPWRWLAVPALTVALLFAFLATRHHPAVLDQTAASIKPGPLTEQPSDPDLATHLANAERLLTEVSHSNGPLDESTRAQAQNLLLSNAVYIRKANAQGDVAEAAVLDKLDRTLTNLQHQSALEETGKGWHLQVAMNTNGLLLDIRILQQNDSSTKDSK